MALLSARRSACVLSAVTAAALMAPSLASAKKIPPPEQCSGVAALEGKGSTLQNNAQQKVWTQDFSTSLNPTACNGANGAKKAISVVYNATGVEGGTGSVQGMEAFGLNGQTPKVKKFNFVGTDEPPNEEQLKEMETANNGTKIESIPVLQASVAIIVHLPKSCTAENSADTEAAGRFVFTNTTLGKIFQGELKTWKSILEAEKTTGKDSIKGKTTAEVEECENEEFKVVVRRDGSGTTHIIKRYLGLIEPANTPFELEEGVAGEKSGAVYTWSGTNDIDQGALNTAWPKSLNKERECNGACEGGGELARWVSITEDTIGYANLSDARGHGFGASATAGSGKPVFWAPIENTPPKGKKPAKFADPSTDGEAAEKFTNANCEETKFTNGEKEKFPPKSTLVSWAAVTTATTEKHYTICGLTYDLAFTSYKSAIGFTTEAEEKEDEAIGTSVRNYLQFELSETGVESGQALLHNFDYLKLTSKLDKTATKGADEVF
jgi:ABC-type phosphate transport system substrate-binding protein